ncbi:MAG: GNAT family N-acetyltransferase [Microthrixaceae bacterium]
MSKPAGRARALKLSVPGASAPGTRATRSVGELGSELAAIACEAFEGEHLLPEDIEALRRSEPAEAGTPGASGVSASSGGASDAVQSSVLTDVFTTADRLAMAVARVDHSGDAPIAHLDVLATDLGHRRRGLARSVLTAAEDWARDQGAEWIEAGDHLPNGLFGGIDVRWTAAMCLFESRGYERVAVKVDLGCPTISASPARLGAGMRAVRVASDDQVETLDRFVAEIAPRHSATFAKAAEWGTAVMAIDGDSGRIYGAAAHSLQRLGVIGPVVIGPGAEERIVIGVMFRTLLGDLATAGLKSAEVVGASTMTPYVEAVGAKVVRVSLVLRRRLQ